MRKCTLAALLLAAPLTLTASDKTPPADPIAWGQISGSKSCVIFAEGHKTSGRFYGVAVTTKTVGKLTVIDQQNYTYSQQEVLETQENMNDMMRVAQRDHVKFVKIPDKYSPDLLDKARAACKSDPG